MLEDIEAQLKAEGQTSSTWKSAAMQRPLGLHALHLRRLYSVIVHIDLSYLQPQWASTDVLDHLPGSRQETKNLSWTMLSPKTPNYRKRQNYSVGECGVLLDYPLHCFSMVDSVPPQLLWFPQVSALRQRGVFLAFTMAGEGSHSANVWSLKISQNLSKSLKIAQNRSKSPKISQNLSKSLKISQNLSKSLKYIQKIIYLHWFIVL